MIKSCWHTFYSHTYTIITLYSFLVLIINEERMIGLCNDNSVPLRPDFAVFSLIKPTVWKLSGETDWLPSTILLQHSHLSVWSVYLQLSCLTSFENVLQKGGYSKRVSTSLYPNTPLLAQAFPLQQHFIHACIPLLCPSIFVVAFLLLRKATLLFIF